MDGKKTWLELYKFTMSSQVDMDLLNILQSSNSRTEAKLRGWEYMLGLTATEDGQNHILESEKYVPFILSYVQDNKSETELIQFALKCLINISSTEKGATTLLTACNDLILNLLNSIDDPDRDFVEHRCYILSNISTHSNFSKTIYDALVSSKELEKSLMKNFWSSDCDIRKKYSFLALVFANISSLSSGRKHLLEEDIFTSGFLNQPDFSEPDTRGLGAALTLRSFCLETDAHEWLLEKENILPLILLPLMGPEEFEEVEMDKLPLECQYLESTKQRERNPQIRRMLVQALTLFCYTELGWKYLKSKGVYYVARELHKWEKDADVIDAIETLVTYLLVEQYSIPSCDETKMAESTQIQPLETDILKDLPDIIL